MTEKYQKKTPIEHVLDRPDMYVGSIEVERTSEFIANENGEIKEKFVNVSQALIRIFIEAISNAIDNWSNNKKAFTSIKVTIDKDTGKTSVWNDGDVVPIKKNKEGDYYHTMIFGQMLTSSNYNDSKERTSSGRNGVGIKLCNIFSKQFIVEGVENGKKLTQKWTNNMRKTDGPKITETKLKNFTKITWVPDFKRVGEYNDDVINLYKKFLFDASFVTGVAVKFNDEKIKIKNFKEYVGLYGVGEEVCFLKSKDSEVAVTPKKSRNDVDSISFVNGVNTKEGGVHVNTWGKEIFSKFSTKLSTKKSSIEVADVKRNFKIFVNSTLVNPKFSSQEKVKLVSPAPEIPVIKPAEITSMSKWEICQEIIASKEMKELKKGQAKKTTKFVAIKGYDKANFAGSNKSKECTLILCEGLSAKTYAVAGMNNKSRDYFGIFPLKGKCLNTLNAVTKKIAENVEIKNINQILGLSYGMDYTKEENFKTLNYGSVTLLTDSDCDGLHISGLIINIFNSLFPSLLKRKTSFVKGMLTPIVKIFPGTKKEKIFYDENEFKLFQKNNKEKLTVKYYKGLGTSSTAEVKQTFGKKMVNYVYDKDSEKAISKAFSKENSDLRKQWLSEYNPIDPKVVYTNNGTEEYQRDISDFIDHELIKFSIADCKRSIPCIIDGFKESQRKIVYACTLKNMKDTIKVAQLSGFVAEKTCYHHGEESLTKAIISMAQSFVGSNNLPLLYEEGQFGSRLENGKDAASGRYLFTRLRDYARLIFRKEDDELLEKVFDDGIEVEPVTFAPIIPMILVNGAKGIGTGWSVDIPMHNPSDVIEAVRCWIYKQKFPELCPWYRGFTGDIKKINKNKFKSFGKITDKGKFLQVVELPVGVSIVKYQDTVLDKLVKNGEIKKYNNYSTEDKPSFQVYGGNEKDLLTTTDINFTNMVLFDEVGKIHKYENVEDILNSFCEFRYTKYEERKKNMIKKLEREILLLKNKHKFIEGVLSGEINLHVADNVLEKTVLPKFDKVDGSFSYLLDLPMRSMTKSKLDELIKKLQEAKKELEKLKKISESDMWLEDLQELEDNI